MSERSEQISKLLQDTNRRTSYIKGKLGVLVPSQIRALRLKSDMPRQADLASKAEMKQSRVSMLETPGAANITLETLARLAAVFKVGLVVKFVPLSEMVRWENTFSQDHFDVIPLDKDEQFCNPESISEWETLAGTSTEKEEDSSPERTTKGASIEDFSSRTNRRNYYFTGAQAIACLQLTE